MLSLALGLVLSSAPEPLTPDHTWLLAVSCLQFKNRKISGLPSLGRTDDAFVKSFGSNHVVWLKDEKADTKRIDFEFREMLGRARKDDVLVVYYTGHGYSDKSDLLLATWNAGVGFPGWSMNRAFGEIRKSFRGRAVVFLADCCASGRLVDYAHRSYQPVAVLSSSVNDEDVPEGWAFTTAMTEVLNGHPQIDTDRNGRIEWAEAASHVQSATQEAYSRSGAAYLPSGLDISWPVTH